MYLAGSFIMMERLTALGTLIADIIQCYRSHYSLRIVPGLGGAKWIG